MPWRSWVSELHAQAMVNGQSSQLLLPDLLQRRLWRRCLAADSQLPPLLDMEAAASNAQRAWSTAQSFRCGNQADDALSLDQQAFQRWSMHYQHTCREQGVIDASTVVEHVCELLASATHAMSLPPTLLLAGFLRETPQQTRLLDCLAAAGVVIERAAPRRRATPQRHRHIDDESELLSIAMQVRQVLGSEPSSSLGVVVPRLQQQRAEVLRAFDRVFFPALNPDQIMQHGRPYDVSLGLPLTEQAVVRSALLLLRLSVAEIDATEISSLLLSPYVIAAGPEARSRERLDRKLREQRTRKLTLRGLIKQLDGLPALHAALAMVATVRLPARATASVWADHFGDMLVETGWPGQSTDSEEYQAINAWHGCLDDLQMLDDGEQLTSHEALALLRRLSRERVFQPETQATPIQIMGRLESHGIDFDHLWIAGLDAEQWPPAGAPTPFLSIARQKQAGVPEASVEARLQLADDEFALWCGSAGYVYVSHAIARDGNELAAAAVIAQLPLVALPLVAGGVVDPADSVRLSGVLEQLADTHGPALDAGSAVRGGARLLENQARCPFKAFALHRLHIRPLEEAGMGLDPRQHGTLLHYALELFWTKTRTHQALMELGNEALDAELQLAIDAALSTQFIADGLRELEQRRLLRLLREWLVECEKPRPPFEVVAFEASREVERMGICMKLQVDRIDKLDSGHTVVLDYKTGTANSRRSWSEDRIDSPQLPLYALTDDAIDGVCFAQVARHKHCFIGIASDVGLLKDVKSAAGDIEDWSAWRTHWRAALDSVAGEIRQGLAAVTPARGACDYCDLTPLCRIENRSDDDDQNFVAGVGDATS